MNKVSKFFHEILNPHCEHCATERKELRDEQREQAILTAQLEQQQREESKFCPSCETLASENARLVRDNERLLETLLAKPIAPEQKIQDVRDLKPITTTKTPFIPTAVRRQMLERESRHTAQLKDLAPKPDSPVNTNTIIDKDAELLALDAELQDVRQNREAETKVG